MMAACVGTILAYRLSLHQTRNAARFRSHGANVIVSGTWPTLKRCGRLQR